MSDTITQDPQNLTEDLDEIIPSGDVLWTFEDRSDLGNIRIEQYHQKPLSFRSKLEFTRLLGVVMDEMLTGEDKVSLDEIMGGGNQFMDAGAPGVDGFAAAISRVAVRAPQFWDEAVCIWLRVPNLDRPWFIGLTASPVDEGGLSDDDAEKILITFAEQNYDDLLRFFGERRTRIQSKLTKIKETRDAASRPSKPSKRTRAITPKE
jgi:hypothetical protein